MGDVCHTAGTTNLKAGALSQPRRWSRPGSAVIRGARYRVVDGYAVTAADES